MHLPRQSSTTYKKSSTVVYTRNRSTDRWSRYSTDHVVLVTYVYLWSYSNTCYSGEISVQPLLACYDEEKAVRSMSCSAALGCPKRPVAVRREIPWCEISQLSRRYFSFFLSSIHRGRRQCRVKDGRQSVCQSELQTTKTYPPKKKTTKTSDPMRTQTPVEVHCQRSGLATQAQRTFIWANRRVTQAHSWPNPSLLTWVLLLANRQSLFIAYSDLYLERRTEIKFLGPAHY
jgi:hypothetical protein